MNNKPIIALIGRQNVGKSTIFNRLIGKRKAIIDSMPGVTRDIVSGEISLDNFNAILWDSGGLSDDMDITNNLVQNKTEYAYNNSDILLFVVEAGNSLPIENQYLKNIKKLNKKIILVMNKSDTPDKDILINDFYNYGVGEAIPVSASHNRNFDLLTDKILFELKNLDSKNNAKENDPDIKISILGKPNVGKSSLLNKIINKERSIVSDIPGTTRDIIDEKFIYNNRTILINDTAGIRKKNKVYEDVEYYSVKRALDSIEHSDIAYFVLDSTEELSDQDKKIIEQIVNKGKPLIIILNKWDLQNNEKNILKNIIDRILFKFPMSNYISILPVSCKTGKGIELLLKKTLKLFNESKKRIETAELNNFIQKIIKKYSPSSKKGLLKIYYGVQVNITPMEFVFFINNKKLISNNYSQYIINKLREEFDFTGIPIKVFFKDK